MAKQYNWRTSSQIISGGYPGEGVGVIPPDTGWRTTSATSGSTSAEYYFHDSDVMNDANSTRVVVGITEAWTAVISDQNYLTITLTTTITGIRRDQKQGNPGSGTRNMFIRREAGGPVLWSISNDPIYTNHTLLVNPISLGTYTFTLAPGQNLSRGSVYFRNNVYGHDSDPVPSIYVDEMWLGTEFKNPLPKDYIPGKIWDTSDWLSHNRVTNGHAKLYNGSAWGSDMKTTDGGVGSDNPPYIRHDTGKKNMRKIGANA